ncbi:hypothetical protein [Aquidulcibacter sp.]|uniref:hypothetical protein n=1 Tax=Aquidulcibacter sp. TaxID=2052990 RepID=UPI0028AF7F43|nr:hypothetical protein [Aquidulcibacter sp.]
MNLKSLLAATALCSVMIAPAYAQTAPKMRDALKSWQLDKPSATAEFVTKSVSEDRAVLENVVFKDRETKKADISFGQLVLQRLPQVDAASDQARFSLTFENGTAFNKDGEKTTIGKIEATGLTQTSNLETFAKWMSGEGGGNGNTASLANSGFDGDVLITNVASQVKSTDGKVTDSKIGNINLIGINLKPDGWSTNSMELLNLQVVDSESTINFGKISATNLKSDGWQIIGDADTFKPEDFDFKKFSLGSMLIEKVTMDVKLPAEKDQPQNFQLAMDRMELTNWTDRKIGKFGLSGMKGTTGVGEKRFDMSLESFTLEDINVAYFVALGGAFAKIMPSLDKKPSGRTALLGFAELASGSALAATVAPVTPSTHSPKLKDLLPGGPLDGGIGAISMSEFGIEAMGFNFTIDQIATGSTRNADGIIIGTRMLPTTMKLTVPDALLNQPNSPMAMFAPLIADGIELVVRYDATYEPTTDVVKFKELGYELKGWAGFNLNMVMDGLAKFYREQTVDSLMAPVAADLKKLNEPKGKGEKKPDDMEQLKRALAIYQGVRFLNGALELRDQGGIAKAAGVFASMMAPPTKGATSRAATQDAQALAQVRQSWAEPLRQSAAEKNKSIMERQFLISLARWIEVGGVMTAVMQPPAPIDFPTLAEPKDLPTRLGLTFTNQSAVKN